MNFLTDRKRAQGMGSGRKGTHHHWQMMASSLGLVFLVPLFILTFGTGLGGTQEEVMAFYSRPLPSIIAALTMVFVLNHLKNEVLEAIEDYVHGVAQKLALLIVTGISYTLTAAGLFALVKLALS